MSNPYIIAEVGSSWASKDDVMYAIAMAEKCGASAVKFQLLSDFDLYGSGTKEYSPPHGWIEQMKEKADACEIDLII